MERPTHLSSPVRFGPFELDVRSAELQYNGHKVLLNEQPFQVLLALLERPGELISREELVHRLWPDGTFVDYERGLNKAVNKLRDVLHDSADSPRFVETIPRRGYRFIAPLEGGRAIEVASGSPVAVKAGRQQILRLITKTIGERKNRSVIAFIGFLIVLLLLAALSYPIYKSRHPAQRKPFERYAVTQSTGFGDVLAAAISPDGKYMAYVRQLDSGEGLWIRQLSTNSDTQVLQNLPGELFSIAFSAEGYLFLNIRAKDDASRGDLYRMPMFGRQPQLILRDIDSPVSFVAEGQKVCFLRGDPKAQQIKVLMADVATGKEKVLWETPRTSSAATDIHDELAAAACNADGTKVALAFQHQIEVLDTSDGWIKILAHLVEASIAWVNSIAWEPKGDGIIISAQNLPGFQVQLFHVSYPEGTMRRITNDLGTYLDISMSADGKALSTVKVDGDMSFYLWSNGGVAARRLDTIKNPQTFEWLGSEKLLFTDSSGNLGIANLATGETKIISASQRQGYWLPSACGEKSVLFSSGVYPGPFLVSIWRMDLETGALAQLTKGPFDTRAKCTGDGKWIIYGDGGKLMKMSPDGLNPQALAATPDTFTWDISLDGKQLLYRTFGTGSVFHLISLDTWQELTTIPINTVGVFRFMPDGDGLMYDEEDHGVGNVWLQPFGGGPRRQLTHFTEDHIEDLHWSPDGQLLGLIRKRETQDAVLFVDSYK